MFRKPAYTVFITAAVLFVIFLPRHPYPLSFLLKAVPAAAAAGLCFRLLRGSDARLAGVGFLFCAAGDIFLDMAGDRFFLHGLASFLIAHLFFFAAFVRHFKRGTAGIARSACLVLYIIMAAGIIVPELGEMRLPVVLYMGVITAMGIAAAFAQDTGRALFAGACLFIFSDSVIAFTRFVYSLPHSGYVVMTTYYAGLFFMLHGMTTGWPKRGNTGKTEMRGG